jgi:hypothetical protein
MSDTLMIEVARAHLFAKYANDQESKFGEDRCAFTPIRKSQFGQGQMCHYAVQRHWQLKQEVNALTRVCRACSRGSSGAGDCATDRCSIREEGRENSIPREMSLCFEKWDLRFLCWSLSQDKIGQKARLF